ncbi:hypothetical protein [Agrococcus sp. ARC_14]|uniref:fascin domain-containing protein n=1 Tax=Agrococcus sp. ARC_14 TaxID=2919927 RepID=UPI001F05121B|nr:hypothetical protein [Agrococcus sp. ARC_14]MCH1882540.1 hypothetical protein [Agrococcus sp. ARC_14]
MYLSVAFAAGDGSQLVAEGGGGGEILANRGGIGPWETFRLFNRSRPGAELRHGDSIALQVSDGGFVAASDGGVHAAQAWIDAAAVFTLERVVGAGLVASGDAVALRAADGRFVVAENNGGGAVHANRARRGPWETLTITTMGQQLVRLRSRAGKFVTAEDGGGREVTANRDAIGLWETFALVNFSRASDRCAGGDTVALRTWSGAYLRVQNLGDVDAAGNQARMDACFRVAAAGARVIRHRQQIALQSLHTNRFLTERAGTINALSRTGTGLALFTVELADHEGIDFEWVPDGTGLAGRPFDPPPPPVPSPRDVLTLHFFERPGEPVTTSARIRSALTGPAPSLDTWLRAMSGGAFRIRDVGVHGPFRSTPVPAGTPDAHAVGHNLLLSGAEASGVPLAAIAEGGIIDSRRTALVHIKAGAIGGQVHGGSATSRSGLRFVGRDAGVGVSTDVNEASRAVLAHEASHLILDVVDRYGFRVPIRGDLIANRTFVGDWEPFVIDRVGGAGPVVSGDAVTLRAHDGGYVSVDAAPPNVVNTEAARSGRAQPFTIEGVAGGAVAHGAAIGLRTAGGRWVTAELGSDGVVTANRVARGAWETFEVQKRGGAGRISSGDIVSFKSSAGLFVSAETARRTPAISPQDRQRGYTWAGTTGNGQGGSFDNADANYSTVMLSVYDRIRLGWARPRYLTPDNRGCFTIRPFLDSRAALILFDPEHPHEWYTVENRQHRENLDEVRSSGLVISWIQDDPGYWQWWLNRSNDPEGPGLSKHLTPAVISAAAPGVPPNMLARPVVFDHASVTKRNAPGAAFTEGEIVLPLGNGDPSRFHLSFHAGASGNVALCLR